jgi:hypothetical protein
MRPSRADAPPSRGIRAEWPDEYRRARVTREPAAALSPTIHPSALRLPSARGPLMVELVD